MLDRGFGRKRRNPPRQEGRGLWANRNTDKGEEMDLSAVPDRNSGPVAKGCVLRGK